MVMQWMESMSVFINFVLVILKMPSALNLHSVNALDDACIWLLFFSLMNDCRMGEAGCYLLLNYSFHIKSLGKNPKKSDKQLMTFITGSFSSLVSIHVINTCF